MSNILDIPQIAVFDPGNLQNDLHIGFTGDLKKRLDKARWTDESKATKTFPEPVDTLIGDFLTAQYQEDEAYVIAQGSDLTKQRLEKDRQRDTLHKEIKKTIDTFATLTIFPDKMEAALAVDADATPQRIVSTDKKALKAGGLMLALAGVAVGPADEVDSMKEYELVAIG